MRSMRFPRTPTLTARSAEASSTRTTLLALLTIGALLICASGCTETPPDGTRWSVPYPGPQRLRIVDSTVPHVAAGALRATDLHSGVVRATVEMFD